MQVWAALFDAKLVENEEYDELYKQALGILDPVSRQKVERFYHRVDSFRGLVGRLLIRMLLKERGVALDDMSFAATPESKPYVTASSLAEPIGYNITHDNGLVAMAFSSGSDLYPDAPAYRIGIDVMLLQLPVRTTFASFVESVSDQLTSFEEQLLLPQEPLEIGEALRRFYLIWTLKEAYSKALGMGLGFDYKRIEYDVPRDVVRVDSVHPIGWKFVRFEVERGDDKYVGVVARYVGEQDLARGECHVEFRPGGDWLKVFDAATFVRRSIRVLK